MSKKGIKKRQKELSDFCEKNPRTGKPKYGAGQTNDFVSSLIDRLDIFQSTIGKLYVTAPINDRNVTVRTDSELLKNWIYREHNKTTGKILKEHSYKEIIEQLNGIARLDGPIVEVHNRVCSQEGEIYIFLGNSDFEAVRITANGWELTTEYPIKFIKPANALPLPTPIKNGKVGRLKKYINTQNMDTRVLVVAWLLGCFSPGPYAPLVLMGDHGSCKSTLTRVLKSLVDPADPDIRALPRNSRDFAISAQNSGVLAFDNLSNINQVVSDTLCAMSTGGGFIVRKNYSDEEEMYFKYIRPVILNGIDLITYSHDLVDRSIIIKLDRIKRSRQIPEKQFWSDFEKDKPFIFGGICNALSTILRQLPSISIKNPPRMADFAYWVCAAEESMPWKEGRFLEAYRANIENATQSALQNDIVAAAVINLMDYLDDCWVGNATKLLNDFESDTYIKHSVTTKEMIRSKAWPNDPRFLSQRLRKAKTLLIDAGIEINFSRTSNKKTITICKVDN